MDCEVVFGAKEAEIISRTLRFQTLPRVGEIVSFNDNQDARTGSVYSVEHRFDKDGPHHITINVECD